MEIYKTNYYNIKNNSYLYFDIFFNNNKLFLINSNINNEINTDKLIIKIDNNILKLEEKIIRGVPQPFQLLIFNCEINNEVLNIYLEYENIKENIVLQNKKVKKNFLTLTTLFKNDYNLFTLFYKYYKNQGIEHFYLYYNGLINNKIVELLNYKDVTLIEWNYEYIVKK